MGTETGVDAGTGTVGSIGPNGSTTSEGGSNGGNSNSENEIPRPLPGKPGKPVRPHGCLGNRGQFASAKGCSFYLNCWDDVAVEQQCPSGLLFNEKKHYCDFDYNVNCSNRPKPTPSKSFLLSLCKQAIGIYEILKLLNIY
jgi:hypothetical protein